MVIDLIREMACDNFYCKKHIKSLMVIALMNKHDIETHDFQSMLSPKHLRTIFNYMGNIRDDTCGNSLLHYSCFYGSSLAMEKLLGPNALI